MMVSKRSGLEIVLRQIALCCLLITCSGCSYFWPYKRDFDCPVAAGVRCTSLYDISKMADNGEFGPQGKKASALKANKAKKKSSFKRKCYCSKQDTTQTSK